MPVRNLPPHPNLAHLKHQAKDLIQGHAARSQSVAQRLREFHPRFHTAGDAAIFAAKLSLSAAQLAIAREHGFASWTRLKAHVETPALAARLRLPHQERIDDPTFRRAVDLIDAGDAAGLRDHLKQHPKLVHRHVVFEGGNYFHDATLLEFVAENPIRHGSMPENIVEVAGVLLDAGVEQRSLDETLMLVATGSLARECRKQLSLIDLLCDRGANPGSALRPAALHGEREALDALIARGAHIDLPVAAGQGRMEDFLRLLPGADGHARHLALALASQFGRLEIVRLLLDAGEDPNRYHPVDGHSHTTPLHQAALEGNGELVRLLLERGARPDIRDVLWQGTPADWAEHSGHSELERYLRARETAGKVGAAG